MRTYYEHDGIRIADGWFIVDDHWLGLRDLTNVGTGRDPADAGPRVVTGSSFGMTLATVIMVHQTASLVLAIGATGLIAGTILGGVIIARLRPRRYRLWGDYRGVPVMLFETPDSDEFGKLVRALQRALEADRSTRYPYDPTGI